MIFITWCMSCFPKKIAQKSSAANYGSCNHIHSLSAKKPKRSKVNMHDLRAKVIEPELGQSQQQEIELA